jgi:hypothetical protein
MGGARMCGAIKEYLDSRKPEYIEASTSVNLCGGFVETKMLGFTSKEFSVFIPRFSLME